MTLSTVTWADPARAAAFAAWLSEQARAHGLDAGSLRPASADASFRRYFRVDQRAGGSLIVMDAPPAQENSEPFVRIAGLLAGAGLKAPRVLAWDEAQGFMLLNDLGSQTMLEVIAPPAETLAIASPTERDLELYLQAADTLIGWQLASKPDLLPAYDEALLKREIALFPDWYVAQHRGIALDAGLRDKLEPLFAQIVASNLDSLGGARVFVHRDFMGRNLMAPRPDDADQRLGVLDFQDAVYGPVTYDIASLLRDAFLSWDEEFVLDVTIRYWEKARKAGLPVGEDFGEFYRAVEWMGLQRHLKVLGIFARLTLRDGKPKYLADTPRFVRYVRNTCARYRQLGPLMVLLDEIEGNETRVGYTF